MAKMTSAAKSLFIWGLYCILLGFMAVFNPNILLAFFGLPPARDIWIRILGVMILALGFYYGMSGLYGEGMENFYRWSIFTRSCLIFILAVFVLLGMARPVLILFGVLDLAAAAWTWAALRTQK
ncbi:MAG: hypothetical protein ACM3WV_03545 [Bacillota bacterium]